MFNAHLTFNTLVFVLQCILVTKCDSYGSLTTLTASEQTFVKHVQEYQRKRINELENLQRKIEIIQLEHDEAIEDVVGYLSNPINAYKLIKRIVIDWNEIHDFIEFGNTTTEFDKTLISEMKNMELPTKAHLHEAVFGLEKYTQFRPYFNVHQIRKIEIIQLEHDEAIEDVVGYLSNPINAYKLIKRIVIDWNEIHDFIEFGNTTTEFDKTLISEMKNMELPTKAHLHEAVFGLEKYTQFRPYFNVHQIRKIEIIQLEHDEAIEDVVGYLSNPINAYKLIKRIVIDWNEIHDFIEFGNTTTEFDKTLISEMKNMELPTKAHLHEAVFGLEKYVAEPGSELTWDECYEIGILLYDRKDFGRAIRWLEWALEKMNGADNVNKMIGIDVVEYIAYSKYFLGLPEEASLTMKRVPGTPVVNTIFNDLRNFLVLDTAGINAL